MSRETKVGLLVSLAVILAFAVILSMNLADEPYARADSGPRGQGVHLVTYQVHGGGDVIDEAVREQRSHADSSHAHSTENQPGENAARAVADVPPPVRVATPEMADAADPRSVDPAASYNDDDHGLMVSPGSALLPETPAPRRVEVAGESRDAVAGEPRAAEPRQNDRPAADDYTVRPGDTLYTIAERVYGEGQGGLWRRILKANPGLDANVLRPGKTLVIPHPDHQPRRTEQAESPRREADETDRPAAAQRRTYLVRAGDTLSEISTEVYGTCRKWQQIVAANPGLDPAALPVGKTLVIPPEGGADPSEVAIADALDRARRIADDTRGDAAPHSQYEVRPGDTLWRIAENHFGDGARWKELMVLNSDQLSAPEDVRTGMSLRVPAVARTAMVHGAATR